MCTPEEVTGATAKQPCVGFFLKPLPLPSGDRRVILYASVSSRAKKNDMSKSEKSELMQELAEDMIAIVQHFFFKFLRQAVIHMQTGHGIGRAEGKAVGGKL
jgi:hypothetical protein